jgi:hypothetical protein
VVELQLCDSRVRPTRRKRREGGRGVRPFDPKKVFFLLQLQWGRVTKGAGVDGISTIGGLYCLQVDRHRYLRRKGRVGVDGFIDDLGGL